MSKIIILFFTSIIISICYSIPITRNSLSEDEDLVKHGSKLIYSIVGGKSSSIAKHPYQVAILVNGTFQGAGIILDNNWVATLSSMVVEANVNDVTVKSGKDDYTQGTTTGVKKIIPHPKFSFYEMDNDLALLKLQKNLKLSKTVKKISVGPKPLKSGTPVTISGWGDTESTKKGNEITFKEVSLDIVERNKCQDAYSVKEITKSMVCAYKKNSGPCWYDFGDVIVSKNKAYGLFSWAKGCASKDAPGVYVDLVALNSWIKSTIKKNSKMNEQFSLYEEEDNSKEILSPETVEKDKEIKVAEDNTKRFEIEKLKKGFELTNKLFASKINEVFADMKDVFSKHHLHHYISKRSVFDNFLINDEDFIKAINKEEKEEENAEEEELEQEKEEEEVEKEAIEVVSEVQKGDRIGSNILDEEEENELNKIKYHAIVKRSIKSNNDEENSDEEIEEAIKEEEEEEEHADEEEKEQEEAEDEAEEDAIKLIGKKMTKSNTEEQNVEDADEESEEEDDQEEDDSEESNVDNNTKETDGTEEDDDVEEEEEEEEEQEKSEEEKEEEEENDDDDDDDDDESEEEEDIREKALEGEESEEDDDAEEDADEEEDKKEKELETEKEENSEEEDEEEEEEDEEEEEEEKKENTEEEEEEEEEEDDEEGKDSGKGDSEEEDDH